MKKGYIPKDQRKKILLMCDDIRTHSGIGTVAREIVIHTAHHFNFVNIGAAIEHPEAGKKFDLSQSTNEEAGIVRNQGHDRVSKRVGQYSKNTPALGGC